MGLLIDLRYNGGEEGYVIITYVVTENSNNTMSYVPYLITLLWEDVLTVFSK